MPLVMIIVYIIQQGAFVSKTAATIQYRVLFKS